MIKQFANGRFRISFQPEEAGIRPSRSKGFIKRGLDDRVQFLILFKKDDGTV
jgi:hypothetical protein